jgi:hypothetical protein
MYKNTNSAQAARRKSWKKSIVDDSLIGNAIDVHIQPLANDRLDVLFRPFTADRKIVRQSQSTSVLPHVTSPSINTATSTLQQSASLNRLSCSPTSPMSPSSSPSPSNIQRKQAKRLQRSAELSHSGFLTETLPLMNRLPSQSEFLMRVEFLPTEDTTQNVRMERRMLRNQLFKLSWGSQTPTTNKNLKEQTKRKKRIQKEEQVLVRRAKIKYGRQQKKITKLLRNEMKGIRRIEKRNTIVRQQRMIQIIGVASSILAFQTTLNIAKQCIEQGRAASVLQLAFRRFIRRRNQRRADHVKTLLGMRVVMVIANLRIKVKKSSAKIVINFIIAIPACTKALVALRLMRQRCIRIQRWWRSFLTCKICRIRSLLRQWCYVESANKQDIRKAVKDQARRERRDAKKSLATLQEKSNMTDSASTRQSNQNTQKLQRKQTSNMSLDSLAKSAHLFASQQFGHQEKKLAVLTHQESRDALDMPNLMNNTIKPIIRESTTWLDDKFMFLGAQNILLSIAAQKKMKSAQQRKKHRLENKSSVGGSRNKPGSKKKSRMKQWSSEWENWIAILRRNEVADYGLDTVPRSEIPIHIRIDIIKELLEKERQRYVRNSVAAARSPFAKIQTSDDEGTRPLVSLHSINFILDGTLSVSDLFDRQRQPMFRVFTSKKLSADGLKKEILDAALAM